MGFKCIRCGNCCETYPIDVLYADICRWDKECRDDILQQVSFIANHPRKGLGGFYIEKTLREPKESCPFLVDKSCSIYETRPMVCVDFPLSRKSPNCPSFSKGIRKERRRLVREQDKELHRTAKNYNHLMSILIEARG
jgi:Fe-S-cluster containining protein